MLKTELNQPERPASPFQPSSNFGRKSVYVATVLLGLISLLMIGYTYSNGNRLISVHSHLCEQVREIRFDITTIHLRFEEMLVGDRTIPMDTIHSRFEEAKSALEAMIAFGHTMQESSHTVDMFGDGDEDTTRKAPEIPDVEDWPVSIKLNGEKEMLGFYVSGHPLARFRRELRSFSSLSTQKIAGADDGREVRVGGIIHKIKVMLDKRGNQMAFVTIEDFTGSLELIVFSDCYEKTKDFIRVDAIVLASGRISTREGQAAKLIVSNILPLDRLSEYYDCRLVVNVDRKDYERIPRWWKVL